MVQTQVPNAILIRMQNVCIRSHVRNAEKSELQFLDQRPLIEERFNREVASNLNVHSY